MRSERWVIRVYESFKIDCVLGDNWLSPYNSYPDRPIKRCLTLTETSDSRGNLYLIAVL